MVFAIGNAFGVGQTVTSGIVSAIGRGIGIVHYEDFIQTNAEINPGNSGGALIDPTGRLVGINTAILSRSGGNQGIGFAIPANLARYIVQQVLTEGRVVRGFLGVHIEDLTANLQQAFKMENLNGALVNEVLPNSAASEAGVQRGDIIVGFNDIDVRDSRHLMLVVARTAPNTETNMTVIRDGAKKVFQIVLKERPDPEHARHSPVAVEDDDDLLRGVTVDDITAENRRSMDIPSSLKGAVIVDIETASPAFQAGLRKGDVVQEVDWKQVADADEAIDISKDVEGADSVLVYIWRRGTKRFVVVEEIAQ
jgi:serine protease Do